MRNSDELPRMEIGLPEMEQGSGRFVGEKFKRPTARKHVLGRMQATRRAQIA
jgi:hypothetical protein